MNFLDSARIRTAVGCIGIAIFALMPACGPQRRDAENDPRSAKLVAPTSAPANVIDDGIGQLWPLRLGGTLADAGNEVRRIGEEHFVMTSPSNLSRGTEVELPNGIRCVVAYRRDGRIFHVMTSSSTFRINGHPVVGASLRQLREWFPMLGDGQELTGYGVLFEVHLNLFCVFSLEGYTTELTSNSKVDWVQWSD